jgi:hypothetical protein
MTTYTLALTLDISQRLDNLQYNIYPSANKVSPNAPDSKIQRGIFAGCYCFQKNDSLALQVNINNDTQSSKVDINIEKILFDMVCLPPARDIIKNSGQNDGLSPYCTEQASHSIADWNNLPAVINQSLTIFNSSISLPILSTGGEWHLKGYLSLVFRVNGKKVQRIFNFDPVMIVGNGKSRNA